MIDLHYLHIKKTRTIIRSILVFFDDIEDYPFRLEDFMRNIVTIPDHLVIVYMNTPVLVIFVSLEVCLMIIHPLVDIF